MLNGALPLARIFINIISYPLFIVELKLPSSEIIKSQIHWIESQRIDSFISTFNFAFCQLIQQMVQMIHNKHDFEFDASVFRKNYNKHVFIALF